MKPQNILEPFEETEPFYGGELDICTCVLNSRNILKFREMLNCFSCGNEEIDEFFRKKAAESINETTHLYIDHERGRIVAAAALACSVVPIMQNRQYLMNLPSVEITYFAVDSHYQKMPMSPNRAEGYLSDYVLSSVISEIYDFTEEHSGASHVLLYSTPSAVHFYERNRFEQMENELFLVRNNLYLDGCIPMLLTL